MNQIKILITNETGKFINNSENPIVLRGFIFPVELVGTAPMR